MIGLVARPYPMTFLSASTAFNPLFPPSNLTNNDYGRVAQVDAGSANGAPMSCAFDLGSVKTVDVLALLWHTAPPGSTYTIAASNAPDFSSGVTQYTGLAMTGISSRDVLPFQKMLLTLAVSVAARYWKITITPPANASLYNMTMSRVFIGKGAQFLIGAQKATLGAKDMNANVTTEIGEMRSQEDQNLIRPSIGLSFEYGKQTEMEQLLGQYTLSLGVSKPMLVCTDLTTQYLQDNIAFGRPEKVVTLESSSWDIWSFEAVVTSLGI